MPTKILKIVKDVVCNEGIQLIRPNDHVNPFDPIFGEAKLDQTPPNQSPIFNQAQHPILSF
jgi:hypothetical protein